jgi:hypothetical protein
MAARLGIFLNGIFTVAAIIVGGLAALFVMNRPMPMDQFEIVIVGVTFAFAVAIWAFGRGVRYVLTSPTNPGFKR